jgi:isopenicillin N synthase-like dioxygenase
MPREVGGFDAVFVELFQALDGVVDTLLQAIGLHLGWGAAALPACVRDGNSVLRIIHYPPLPESVPPGAVRAAQHEDINLLTVLPVSTQPGLELLTRDGRWMPVDPPAGVMVCDTGDMLARMSGGRLPAVTHRVVNPTQGADRSRYSLPFFCHPRPDVVLAPPGQSGELTAGAFLRERLRATGVAS